MFLVRHERLTERTMAAQSHEIYGRVIALTGQAVPPEGRSLLADLGDQFDRVRGLSDGEKEFLFGVIDLYQTRVATRMTVAVERLAVLAAVTLPGGGRMGLRHEPHGQRARPRAPVAAGARR